MKEYIWEVLIAADRLGNAVLGGSADDTISARCGKKINKGGECYLCKYLCKVLDKIDPGHCAKSARGSLSNK